WPAGGGSTRAGLGRRSSISRRLRGRAGRARLLRCPATSPQGCTALPGRPTRRRAARAARGPPCTGASADAREELLAAEHPLELALPLLVAELGDARVRRVTRNLLDPEMAVGERRDLRQVRDRDHLRAFGEALERPADRVCSLASDAAVDLVEDQRLAACDGSDC